MNPDFVATYCHPASQAAFDLEAQACAADGSVTAGDLIARDSGERFPIADGIADLVYPRELAEAERETRATYERVAQEYDQNIPLTFYTYGTDEWRERGHMVDLMGLQPTDRVLEFGCGTGRTTQLIAERLGPEGVLVAQDLSPAMLERARQRLAGAVPAWDCSLGNGQYLPFPDNSFDAVHHFGGLNMFPDITRCLAETVRVTRPGGRVVVGDESMPPWLRNTTMGRVLMHSQPHFQHDLPLAHMPVEARKVRLDWIIGGVFYVIAFEVGEGEPPADLHFRIPGARGGTHWTRYFGQLEGVTPEAKAWAEKARQRRGESMHDWLDRVVRDAARHDLGQDGDETP